MTEFTHISGDQIRMVDVSEKDIVSREATASGSIILREQTLKAIADGTTSILSEWFDIKHGRVVRIIEDGDLGKILAAYRMWSDLGTLEIFPVTHTDGLITQ